MASGTRKSQDTAIEVVVFSPRNRGLAVLLKRPRIAVGRWTLPRCSLPLRGSVDAAAAQVTESTVGISAAWLCQAITAGVDRQTEIEPLVSVGYVAVVGMTIPRGIRLAGRWYRVTRLPALSARHHVLLAAALRALQATERLDETAQQLMPEGLTLGALQRMHEVLLGRRLVKANFRRRIAAGQTVVATGRYQTTERGRPAQLFRFANGGHAKTLVAGDGMPELRPSRGR